MSIESRLNRLEAARPEPVIDVVVSFADEFDPPLKPGWNPEEGIFQIVWPDEKTELPPPPPSRPSPDNRDSSDAAIQGLPE